MSNSSVIAYSAWRSRLRMILWGGALALYLIPVVAKLIGGEKMLWDGADFIFAAVLIGGAAALVDLGVRKANSFPYAVAAAIAVGLGFLTIWVNGAVGIIGNEDNPANVLFIGVIAFAILGSAIAMGRAAPMAKAMTATAVAQLAVAVIAAFMGHFVVIFTMIMCAMWLLSAGLFRRAAQDHPLAERA